jgi:DNA-binding HxlR family transcriptional regulator
MDRTYGQYCGLARSLDHVGDRWTLLIIRELLVAPARYRELQDGLPGVATNLLAQRLRQLETDGLVQRRLADDGSAAVLYELTPLGADLDQVIFALVRWGTTWMLTGPGDDAFRPRWLVVALRSVLEGSPSARPTRVTITCGDQPVGVTRGSSGLTVSLGGLVEPHATLTGEPDAVLALATRTLTLEDLERAGALQIDGSSAAIRRALFATTGRDHHGTRQKPPTPNPQS